MIDFVEFGFAEFNVLKKREGIIGGVAGVAASAATVLATVLTGFWQTEASNTQMEFEQKVSDTGFVQEFSDRSKANEKDIEFLEQNLKRLEQSQVVIKRNVDDLNFADEVEVFDARLGRLEATVKSWTLGDTGEMKEFSEDLDALRAELQALKVRLANEVDLQALAKELAENHTELLRGPKGEQGLIGPKGDQGTSPDLNEIIASLPNGSEKTAPIGRTGVVQSGYCFDIVDGPNPSVIFEDGAMICDGQTTLATMRNRSSQPGRLNFDITGGRSYILSPGQSRLINEKVIFQFNKADPELGTFSGSVSFK